MQAWLARIGLDAAPATADLPTLDALIAAQLAHIPFENLNSLTGRPVRIELSDVFEKLVTEGRGGYCFELNTLFCAGLKALGYTVVPLAARVRWRLPADHPPTGLSHMLLRVEVAHESYLADVGFGGTTPDRALPLSLPIDPAEPVPAGAHAGGAVRQHRVPRLRPRIPVRLRYRRRRLARDVPLRPDAAAEDRLRGPQHGTCRPIRTASSRRP